MKSLLGTMVNKPPSILTYKPSPDLELPSCCVGVEVEAERVPQQFLERPPAIIKNLWKPHIDDSLRNNGMEFSFIEPFFGQDVVTSVRAICEVAANNKFASSQRTGIHVHLDVRDLNVEQGFRLLTLYALTERPLYNWIGDNREGNHFCLPWYMAQADLKNIAKALFSPPGMCQSMLRNIHRYSGCNLNALSKFGSIEFRHMKTCFDPVRILNWINILMRLKKSSVEMDMGLKELCDYAVTIGPRAFLDEVYGKYAGMLWYPEYYKDIYEYGLLSVDEFIKTFELELNNNRKDITGKAVPKPPNFFIDIVNTAGEESGEHPAYKKAVAKAKGKEGTNTIPIPPPTVTLDDIVAATRSRGRVRERAREIDIMLGTIHTNNGWNMELAPVPARDIAITTARTMMAGDPRIMARDGGVEGILYEDEDTPF